MDARSKIILLSLFFLVSAIQGCATVGTLSKEEILFFNLETDGVITSPCIISMLDGTERRFTKGQTRIVLQGGLPVVVGRLEFTRSDSVTHIPLTDVRAIAPVHPLAIDTQDSASIESLSGRWFLTVLNGMIDSLHAEGTRIDKTGRIKGNFALALRNIADTNKSAEVDFMGAAVIVAIVLLVVGLTQIHRLFPKIAFH